MAKFYFTYGTDEEFPFRGGWSEVEADNLSIAVEIFNLMHPKRKSGCHERISVTRELLTP